MKFAAIELVPETSSNVPETLFGYLNSDGEVVGGIPIPGLASILSDPSEGTATVIQRLDAYPEKSRIPDAERPRSARFRSDVDDGQLVSMPPSTARA
jgi:cytochrome bd-type quinol oxidase subunit 1